MTGAASAALPRREFRSDHAPSRVLECQEKHLNIRAFANAMKQGAFERQKGICKLCAKQFDVSELEADHTPPWTKGGNTHVEKCQILCKSCNRRKSNR